MEKLKKHLRLGGSKKGGAGSQRGEYTAAQKSCSAQDLIPQRLKLPTLKYRRARVDMIEVYKMIRNPYDANATVDVSATV